MPTQTKSEQLEAKIIEAARQTFIEKGYNETNMCDIAAKAGINRPALHYYFRTKERMYRAVFGSIVSSLMPKIRETLTSRELPIEQRVSLVVDEYYGNIFGENPRLPLFVIREMDRDPAFLIGNAREQHMTEALHEVAQGLQSEMDDGLLRRVPLRFVFYTFYGMLTIPFFTRGITAANAEQGSDDFGSMLAEWKRYIVEQMTLLLRPDGDSEATTRNRERNKQTVEV